MASGRSFLLGATGRIGSGQGPGSGYSYPATRKASPGERLRCKPRMSPNFSACASLLLRLRPVDDHRIRGAISCCRPVEGRSVGCPSTPVRREDCLQLCFHWTTIPHVRLQFRPHQPQCREETQTSCFSCPSFLVWIVDPSPTPFQKTTFIPNWMSRPSLALVICPIFGLPTVETGNPKCAW